MIRGAIFDVDGTLLDSLGIWADAASRYLIQKGVVPETDLGRRLFQMSVEEGSEYLKKQYCLHENCEEIASDVLMVVEEFYRNEAPLKNGATELLRQLADRGIPMAVASSGEKAHIEAAFQRLGILQYFQKIFTCSEAGAGKSNPLIYHCAAEELGTCPEDTYVFEDALYAIRTASKAGFRTVGVCDCFSADDQEAIRSLADIYLPDLTKTEEFWRNIDRFEK